MDDEELRKLIMVAINSEIRSHDVYSKLAQKAKNYFLKERLLFLAGEEEKHRIFFEQLHSTLFPGTPFDYSVKASAPLPEIKMDENSRIPDILAQAMEAEKAASEFYKHLAGKLENENARKMVLYISTMELGHYVLIKSEFENASNFEDFNVEWPMMHIGP